MLFNTIELIKKCAEIPSFSSYEERIFPFIDELTADLDVKRFPGVPGNNIIIKAPGARDLPPVAITAHLDKINHFGEDRTSLLPVEENDGRLIGQLDDAAGVGCCLDLLLKSKERNFPTLYILLSEVEEGMGLREHPHLMKNNGEGLHPRIGAERIADYLIANNEVPSLFLTIDTTPFFKGDPGIAVYSRHWEKNELEPLAELIERTEEIENMLLGLNPEIQKLNNINDYVTYGERFNRFRAMPVVSLAVEPAIHPYHQLNESVFTGDILKVVEMLANFLEDSDWS